jgi:hypothetical protein
MKVLGVDPGIGGGLAIVAVETAQQTDCSAPKLQSTSLRCGRMLAAKWTTGVARGRAGGAFFLPGNGRAEEIAQQ